MTKKNLYVNNLYKYIKLHIYIYNQYIIIQSFQLNPKLHDRKYEIKENINF